MTCIFCKILNKEIPSFKIYEDENTYAFLDINPINKGHTLVISKKHYKDIYDIPENTLKHLILTVKKLSIPIKQATNADGISISQNNEEAAGQVIFHIHFHIIPKFKNKTSNKYKEGEAQKLANKIKTLL
ncbi:HIT family protein [archaeon]|nr:HIT family protein [archaeon]